MLLKLYASCTAQEMLILLFYFDAMAYSSCHAIAALPSHSYDFLDL